MRALLITAALLATPCFADETTGTVQSFDAVGNVLVLTDKTVWELPAGLDLPADLGAGDRVRLDYETAGEAGLTRINAVTRTAIAGAADTGS